MKNDQTSTRPISLREEIERAVLAERERCVRVVEDQSWPGDHLVLKDIILEDIREGKEP